MAQVVATRSIQSTFPSFGSAHQRAQKLLKPPTFASKVFPPQGNKSSKLGFRSSQISARKSAPAEVIPVSPEDDPKIEEHLQHLRGVQPVTDNSVGMWSKQKKNLQNLCPDRDETLKRERLEVWVWQKQNFLFSSIKIQFFEGQQRRIYVFFALILLFLLLSSVNFIFNFLFIFYKSGYYFWDCVTPRALGPLQPGLLTHIGLPVRQVVRPANATHRTSPRPYYFMWSFCLTQGPNRSPEA